MSRAQLEETLAEAEAILEATGYVYWRPLTAKELQFGDIDTMRKDFDAAEARLVKAAKPVVQRIVAQMLEEMKPAMEAGDMAAIARVQPSFVGELALQMGAATQTNVASGKRQLLNAAKKAGVKLAKKTTPPRKDVEKAAAYIASHNDAVSEALAAQIAQITRRVVSDATAGGLLDITEEISSEIADSTDKMLVAQTIGLAREAYSIGRLFAYEEVKAEVDHVVYTAVMDEQGSTCEVCRASDGTEYEDPDEGFASAPNEDCLGGDRCRCVPILIWKR